VLLLLRRDTSRREPQRRDILKQFPPRPASDTTPPFPAPKVVIGGRKFWPKRTIREWLAEVAGDPPPPPRDDDEFLLTTAAVREMCGNVSSMWIWRRSQRKAAATEAA
jgi:hypothetical protein